MADELSDPACFSGHQRPEAAKRICAIAAEWRRAHPQRAARRPRPPRHAQPQAALLLRRLRHGMRRLRRSLNVDLLQDLGGGAAAVVGVIALFRFLFPGARGVRRGAVAGAVAPQQPGLQRRDFGHDNDEDDDDSDSSGEDNGAAAALRRRRRQQRRRAHDAARSNWQDSRGAQRRAHAAAAQARAEQAQDAETLAAAGVGEDADEAVKESARFAAEMQRRAARSPAPSVAARADMDAAD